MPRVHSLIATTGLTVLVAACDVDSTQPLGPSAREPQPRGGPALAVEKIRFQSKGSSAGASFTSTDPTGCIESSVFVFGGESLSKVGSGSPSSDGPGTFVQIVQENSCTGTLSFLDGGGPAELFQANRRLTEAILQATITVTDEETGEEFPVQIDLTWTGTGDLLRQASHNKFQLPGLVEIQSSTNRVREASATGSILLDGVDIAPDSPFNGFISRDTQLDVQHTIS